LINLFFIHDISHFSTHAGYVRLLVESERKKKMRKRQIFFNRKHFPFEPSISLVGN
jgi:hypothetical protein